MKLRLRSGAVLLLSACLGYGTQTEDWKHDRKLLYSGPDWHAVVFADVVFDLQHIEGVWPDKKADKRIELATYKLDDLQYRFDHGGKYDPREVEGVIRSLSMIAGDDRLASSERDFLNDDLNKLRDYEANHDHWGRR